MLPSAFHLRNIEISPCEPKECIHSSQRGPQQSLAGAYGNVDHAKWKKPTGTVEVAIKSLRVGQQLFFCLVFGICKHSCIEPRSDNALP